jgi:SAM-dependent methyltransferase
MSLSGNLYSDLSGYYDQFCAEIDYAGQCAFARRLFDAFARSDGREYLDLACGTGQHLLDMQQHGYVPHGLDNSAEMLARAALRCPQASLQLCDLAAFDQQGCFDFITCFLYSLHYSHPTVALCETLKRSFAALKPGGVLLFNAVDARGVQNDDGVTTRLQDGTAALSFRSGWNYRGTGEVLDLHLSIARESAEGRQEWRDHHVMTAVTFPQLQELLERAGFDVTVLAHDYDLLCGWDGSSANAIFVACKPLPLLQ